MWVRGIREQSLSVEYVNFVHAVFYHLLLYAVQSAAGYDTLQFHAQRVGEFASFCEQFERDILHCRALYLAIYKNVVH